jgi:hypothetical protein
MNQVKKLFNYLNGEIQAAVGKLLFLQAERLKLRHI